MLSSRRAGDKIIVSAKRQAPLPGARDICRRLVVGKGLNSIQDVVEILRARVKNSRYSVDHIVKDVRCDVKGISMA